MRERKNEKEDEIGTGRDRNRKREENDKDEDKKKEENQALDGELSIPSDIRVTLMKHIINHGLMMREAGQRVQSNSSHSTAASVIHTCRLENRDVLNVLH